VYASSRVLVEEELQGRRLVYVTGSSFELVAADAGCC